MRRGVEYAVSWVAFVLVLLPLAIPYCQTQQLLGRRPWEEVVTMLPRWQSYFYGPDSIIWGNISQGMGAGLPTRHEHKLFPGILPYVAIIAFFYCCFRKKFDQAQLQVSWAMISAPEGEEQTINLIPGRVEHVELKFPSRGNSLIKFETETEGVKLPNAGTGALFFDFVNPTLRRAKD